MPDKKELIKEFILKNPNLSGNQIYTKTKGTPLAIRKTDFYKIFRETKNLPEPSITKRERSIPIKYKVKPIAKPKVKIKPKPKVKPKPPKIPFEQTKFGKITKSLQKAHNITEKRAIIHARKILKIPRKDYGKMNQKDVQILLHETP